ncbi:MAG: hypothetical protein GY859_32500, partial [Desulfobacterales bacterium]|nr:hypothetical protein [Desulfobacterales bacterium]
MQKTTCVRPFHLKPAALDLLIVLVLLALLGCTTGRPRGDQALARAVTGLDPPRSAAVLPFVNDTAMEGLGELFRVSFYSHFSARPFEDVELHLVDRRLGDLGLGSGDMDEADPVRLGRLLGCDAVIMGAATEFNRVFVGVYSQLSVGGS